jgi:hypothetical protein
MKKYVSLFLFLIPSLLHAAGQNNLYADNMKAAKIMMDSSTVENSYLMAATYFSRIAGMNPGEWLPRYYAAFCYARISHLIKDEVKQDAWVDHAQEQVDKAFELAPENAEVLIMKGFVLQARMNINPAARGFRFTGETMGYFEKARSIDPDNPRSYLWQGVNLLHTPEAYGGGAAKACPLIQKALEKFAVFEPADSLSPNWGYGYAKEIAGQCTQ